MTFGVHITSTLLAFMFTEYSNYNIQNTDKEMFNKLENQQHSQFNDTRDSVKRTST